jgi:hypothetical protein
MDHQRMLVAITALQNQRLYTAADEDASVYEDFLRTMVLKSTHQKRRTSYQIQVLTMAQNVYSYID